MNQNMLGKLFERVTGPEDILLVFLVDCAVGEAQCVIGDWGFFISQCKLLLNFVEKELLDLDHGSKADIDVITCKS